MSDAHKVTDELADELIGVAIQVATQSVDMDLQCHKDLCPPKNCSRCGPIIKARKLLNKIQGSEIYRTRF